MDEISLKRAAVEVRETHLSRVYLTQDEAWKLKKHVDLGFVDFRTLEQRRRACEAEVWLNARLAPGVYLGVVPLRGSAGNVIDYAVRMKRLPDDARADVLLERGALGARTLEKVAELLARFHSASRADATTARYGTVEAITANVRENFGQTRGDIERCVGVAGAAEIEGYQMQFLRDHASEFAARAASGRVRDGHGDLRLEHVYTTSSGAIQILDCIEFSDRFRYADVCADVAFLSMDLASKGRVDLAEQFLARYARESGDFDLYALVDFYESYRAFVRAKIAVLRGDEREARRFFLLALAADRRPLLAPAVVAVGGVIASGKSTVAEFVGARMGAPVIDADRTRKQMLGVAPTERLYEPAWRGAYDPAFTERVYAEVLRRADVVLESGRPVVLDASFRSVAMRAAARELARRHGVPFRFVECRATLEQCRERLARREREAGVSDGRRDILESFAARFEPLDDLAPREHVVVDTSDRRGLVAIDAELPSWPLGM